MHLSGLILGVVPRNQTSEMDVVIQNGGGEVLFKDCVDASKLSLFSSNKTIYPTTTTKSTSHVDIIQKKNNVIT